MESLTQQSLDEQWTPPNRPLQVPRSMLPDNLPPSLTYCSSSPLLSSPKTARHSDRVLRNFQFIRHIPSPTRQGGFDILPSSPPDLEAGHGILSDYHSKAYSDGPYPKVHLGPAGLSGAHISRSSIQSLTPSRLTVEHRPNTGSALLSPLRPGRLTSSEEFTKACRRRAISGTRRINPNHRNSDVQLPTPSKRKREEFMLAGTGYGFIIQSSGRAALSRISPARKKIAYSRDFETILTEDSDSENESEVGENRFTGSDAMSAFTRIVARANVGCIRNHDLPDQVSDRSFFDCGSDAYATTPSAKWGPVTPSSDILQRENHCWSQQSLITITPPGAVFAFDSGNEAYNTGMTPYVPRS